MTLFTMSISVRQLRFLVGMTAIVAPLVHSLTDVIEWVSGGFSVTHLWANYVAFMLIPSMVIGLWAMQWPKIGWLGLLGALFYGFSFIYFTHTTQYALLQHIANYQILCEQLGLVYTVHGALMIIGGVCFGVATYRAGVLPRWCTVVFLIGIGLNLILALIQVAELWQTLGSALRNLGLIGMGGYLLQSRKLDLH